DHGVDATEGVERALHDGVAASPGRNGIGIGHGLAAGRADFLDHALRGAGIAAFAAHRHAQVIDHHTSASRRHAQGNASSDTATGARYHHYLAFHHSAHRILHWLAVCTDREACPFY